MQQSDAYRKFIGDELPGLLLDGLRKAEVTRSTNRVRRIAQILGNSIAGRSNFRPTDRIEEFMRIAMNLEEVDVTVLNEIVFRQAALLNQATGRLYSSSAEALGLAFQSSVIALRGM